MRRSGCITCRRIAACVVALAAAVGGHDAKGQSPTSPPTQPATVESLPVLTNAVQVQGLTRADAGRGYRVVMRGVVTCSLPALEAVVMQDATRGIYINHLDPAAGGVPSVGELVEVEGVTDPGEFAPLIRAGRITRLGAGALPQPIQPAWDQLINGSLDSVFAEIQGVVIAVRTDGVTLLTHGGRISVELLATGDTAPGGALKQYENSLIRLRGCLFARWDSNTHQVKVGEIRMFSPAITVDEPAREDLFAVGPKRVSELLLFDPEASGLRRVKVSGQIVLERQGEYWLVDGANGMRFSLREPASLAVGDLVEVVGFPSLTGPSPVLRESAVRRLGSSDVPEARPLAADELFRAEHDATRVRVQAVLVSLSANQRALELQDGLQRFVARLDPRSAPMTSVPAGSRLELTGVYAGQGGSRTPGGEVRSFELLLNSPADIRVLAWPPFWTLPRMLVLVGAR